MIQHYLESIENIDVFAITAMLIFVVIFIAVVIWIFKIDKKYINKMENLPFDK
ncbi:MAG: CcoQ/FixQ family Cbb3-type cytochrome c oxidase assembly chaperone [Ignavibacteriae bacterium]|nr:CcoQ/FixQ family Cbb3-type cytochrome c oxidase assembly chaperone [Ignavibacteriota bacterium]